MVFIVKIKKRYKKKTSFFIDLTSKRTLILVGVNSNRTTQWTSNQGPPEAQQAQTQTQDQDRRRRGGVAEVAAAAAVREARHRREHLGEA